MPTSGVQTHCFPVPTASSNVRRGTGQLYIKATTAVLLADTMGAGQDIYLTVKVDYRYLMTFAHIHAYVYTRKYMCTYVGMPGYVCTSVYGNVSMCINNVCKSTTVMCT